MNYIVDEYRKVGFAENVKSEFEIEVENDIINFSLGNTIADWEDMVVRYWKSKGISNE